jgi:hypothetical protein
MKLWRPRPLAMALAAACAALSCFAGCAGGGVSRPNGADAAGGGAAHDSRTTGGTGGAPDAAFDVGREPADAADARPDAASPDYRRPEGDPALVAIAGELHGAFLELECDSEELQFQYCVPRDEGMRSLTLAFGGEAGKKYAVVLEVWGVVEGVSYAGGTQAGEHFYIGGKPLTPKTAVYALEAGAETYHLNHFEIGVGAGDHYTYGMHYTTPSLTIPGAATLVLSARDPDNLINTNHMMSAAENPPPALVERLARMKDHPPPWQYLYLEVKSARLVP